MTTPLLQDRHAVIYGAAGALGSAVARTFAQEGAHVHLVGRTEASLSALAAELGAGADHAVLDARDPAAVGEHLAELPRVDVSLNLITRGDVHGQPLVEMAVADLMAPMAGLASSFITAQAAARRMIEQGAGVILWLNSASGPLAGPGMGGTGPADAALDNFMRQLASDHGRQGLRTCGIWTAGVGREIMAQFSALGRPPSFQEVADAAAFLASDRASGTTGSVLNVTAGVVIR